MRRDPSPAAQDTSLALSRQRLARYGILGIRGFVIAKIFDQEIAGHLAIARCVGAVFGILFYRAKAKADKELLSIAHVGSRL